MKERLTFDEFHAVVNKVTNDCFENNTYNADIYSLSLKAALLVAYVPELADEMSLLPHDNNALFEYVYDDDKVQYFTQIEKTPQYNDLIAAINDSIAYRKSTFYTLEKLVAILIDFLENMDLNGIDNETVKALADVKSRTNDSEFAGSLVDILTEKGLIAPAKNNIKKHKNR